MKGHAPAEANPNLYLHLDRLGSVICRSLPDGTALNHELPRPWGAQLHGGGDGGGGPAGVAGEPGLLV